MILCHLGNAFWESVKAAIFSVIVDCHIQFDITFVSGNKPTVVLRVYIFLMIIKIRVLAARDMLCLS